MRVYKCVSSCVDRLLAYVCGCVYVCVHVCLCVRHCECANVYVVCVEFVVYVMDVCGMCGVSTYVFCVLVCGFMSV